MRWAIILLLLLVLPVCSAVDNFGYDSSNSAKIIIDYTGTINLSDYTGTLIDGAICVYNASGDRINCNYADQTANITAWFTVANWTDLINSYSNLTYDSEDKATNASMKSYVDAQDLLVRSSVLANRTASEALLRGFVDDNATYLASLISLEAVFRASNDTLVLGVCQDNIDANRTYLLSQDDLIRASVVDNITAHANLKHGNDTADFLQAGFNLTVDLIALFDGRYTFALGLYNSVNFSIDHTQASHLGIGVLTSENISESDIANWDTAFGWGDHSVQHYYDRDVDNATLQTLKVDNATFSDNCALLAGELPSTYLDDTTLSDADILGFGYNHTADLKAWVDANDDVGTGSANCSVDMSCSAITYDSELAYINNCSASNSCGLIVYGSNTTDWDKNSADDVLISDVDARIDHNITAVLTNGTLQPTLTAGANISITENIISLATGLYTNLKNTFDNVYQAKGAYLTSDSSGWTNTSTTVTAQPGLSTNQTGNWTMCGSSICAHIDIINSSTMRIYIG